MSRPFSYNDENFTVIGNILFVHVDIGGDNYKTNDILCTIPQAIFTRMISYNQRATVSNKTSDSSGYHIGVTCNEDGKLIAQADIPASVVLPRYLLTWYVLKDI